MRAFAVALFCLVPGLAAGQELALTNIRNTYGELGGTRADSKFLPGDVVFVAFDIENITVAADGTCKYSMGMTVNDKAGKPTLKQDPAEREDYIPLGGNKLPARAFVTIGLDMAPGEYTVNVDVTDKNKKMEEKKKTEDKKPVDPPKKTEDKKDSAPEKPAGPQIAPPPKPVEPKGGKPKEPVPSKRLANRAKQPPPTASVSGKATLAGKPLAEGEVTIVTLNLPLPRVFTATIVFSLQDWSRMLSEAAGMSSSQT